MNGKMTFGFELAIVIVIALIAAMVAFPILAGIVRWNSAKGEQREDDAP